MNPLSHPDHVVGLLSPPMWFVFMVRCMANQASRPQIDEKYHLPVWNGTVLNVQRK